jgi:hypothetical protein
MTIIIDKGSWAWRGRALWILDLLDSGVFTAERAATIREAVEARP